jgi:hypothetical protein
MTDSIPSFQETDFSDPLPPEGYHKGVIDRARFRTSERGNMTLQVIYELPDAQAGYDTVADYFVLAGSSLRGLAVSRRRLLELYRACGLHPKNGDPIRPADLEGSHLEIRIGHEVYEGAPRLRVLGYRQLP